MYEKELVAEKVLKTLVPPNLLDADNFFGVLAGKAYVEELGEGEVLFRAGDSDGKTTYLLEGEVRLTNRDGESTSVLGGTQSAKMPLANVQPRNMTAKAMTDCKITRLDTDLLDILLTWDQLSGIEVEEIGPTEAKKSDDNLDWMTQLLQSHAFHQIPPANIQKMFLQMKEVPVRAGERIVKQGEEGDFYYIIKKGSAEVTRSASSGADVVLASLSEGEAFGEEALLAETQRNATVVMETDGVLMRLSKEDFDLLLREPVINWLPAKDLKSLIESGAKMIDVRHEKEFLNDGVEGSENIPLYMLRLRMASLECDTSYITYCDSGRRSSAAAFLLAEKGFDCYVLKGGLRTLENLGIF